MKGIWAKYKWWIIALTVIVAGIVIYRVRKSNKSDSPMDAPMEEEAALPTKQEPIPTEALTSNALRN